MINYSEDGDTTNPMVTFEEDDLEDSSTVENKPVTHTERTRITSRLSRDEDLRDRFMSQVTISKDSVETENSDISSMSIFSRSHHELNIENDFPLWAGDSSARRSPEGM